MGEITDFENRSTKKQQPIDFALFIALIDTMEWILRRLGYSLRSGNPASDWSAKIAFLTKATARL